MRPFMLGFATLLFISGFVPPASAQTKDNQGKCYPNFLEVCTKQCIKVGGRIAGCPAYCDKQKRERNCP